MRTPAYLPLIDTINADVREDSTLLALRRGQTYGIEVNLLLDDAVTPENLTGRTFRVVVRRSESSTQVLFEGTSTTPANGDGSAPVTIINAAAGRLGMFNLDQDLSLKIVPGLHYYALLDTTGGKSESVIEGPIEAKEGVGR
jgi:hypothetical protein